MIKKLNNIPKELKILKKPPKELFYIGDTTLLNNKKVSIVGTRRPINYTKEMTHKLSSSLSKIGFSIVSGAAMGVDAIAHKAALTNTIAIMPNSLDFIYPKVNRSLIEDIYKNALALSEYESGYKATKYSFVIRNRVVVALGDFLIITEADENSGSLRSAEIATKLGKEIYVLSHRIGQSKGTQKLLKLNLARPIHDIDEFLAKFEDQKVQEQDQLLLFCKNSPTLQEALDIYGDKIYEYELEGKIKIDNLRVHIV